jgi:hypothetical protein
MAGRLIKMGAVGALLALCALVFTGSAAASQPLVPPGFQLKASDGYKLYGIFFDGTPHEERDELILIVARKGAVVTYFTPAQVDETSVSADLGALGSVDLHFVSAGRPRSEPTPCGTPKRVQVERGTYEGSIDFRGEEGFASARAKQVQADASIVLGLICGQGGAEGFGGHSPGARLAVHRRATGESTEFVARKNSPTRIARFQASIEERRGRIGISRAVVSTAAPSTFRFAFPAQTAVVRPGAPFHGSVTYDGSRGRLLRARGDLSVDFPGHRAAHLLGDRTGAGMIRYVDNPSHPF